MAEHIPKGLRHVLEVVRLVRKGAMDRGSAVEHVAKIHRVDPQTVRAACTRSLEINTEELDDFLDRDASPALCQHLVRRFPQYQDYIEDFFRELTSLAPIVSPEDPARSIRTLFPDEQKQLLTLLLLKEAERSLCAWLQRNDLPAEVKTEMRALYEKVTMA